VHHLLEEILNEYIVAAGLESGQPCSRALIRLGQPGPDELLTGTMSGLQFETEPRRRVFSPPLDVTIVGS
jgi:hypothetical protein